MKILIFLKICFIAILISTSLIQAQEVESKLSDLGIELPEVQPPIASYVKWKQVGNLLYLAGHGTSVKGTLGKDLSISEGYDAAKECGVNILATLKAATGNLDRIKQFVKVHGMVRSTPDFTHQPKVINGFSDLMVEVFGEKGKHARAAVGQAALPGGMAVEIEVIVELE